MSSSIFESVEVSGSNFTSYSVGVKGKQTSLLRPYWKSPENGGG